MEKRYPTGKCPISILAAQGGRRQTAPPGERGGTHEWESPPAPHGEWGRPVLLVRFNGGEFFFDGGEHALPSYPLEVFALRHGFRKWDSPHSNLSGHRGAHRSEGKRMDVPGGWLSQAQFIGYVGVLHSSSIPVPESPAINAKQWLWLILLSNMHGSSFLFQKLAVGSVPPPYYRGGAYPSLRQFALGILGIRVAEGEGALFISRIAAPDSPRPSRRGDSFYHLGLDADSHRAGARGHPERPDSPLHPPPRAFFHER